MSISRIQIGKFTDNQLSFKNKEGYKSYLDAEGAVNTDKNVKPLLPEGYLIKDNLASSIKYFFKDIGYDIKAVRNGLKGTANDHQAGRFNDIGLTTAGILIATYLASKTTDPKAKAMEYVGLATFLSVMAIYPKLAINGPAKMRFGFDVDKQYIDDQGRKKSVFQDSNYIPYDMYLSDIPEEDLYIIGDRMGIPRDILNRNDVIREQMRKISIQNNTLWMLTAGFATPTLTALLCCGLENFVVSPAIANIQNQRVNNLIIKTLEKTKNISLDVNTIKTNKLNEKVDKILKNYIGKELPEVELKNILTILSEEVMVNTQKGIEADLRRIITTSANNGAERVLIGKNSIDDIIIASKESLNGRNKQIMEAIFVPSQEEIVVLLEKYAKNPDFEKGFTLSKQDIISLKQELSNLIDKKINNSSYPNKEYLTTVRDKLVHNVADKLELQKSNFISEVVYKKLLDFAKIMGDFKENQQILDKCKSKKVEFAPETVIARSYAKFEGILLDSLGINFSDLRKMRESSSFTKDLLDKKLVELAKDDIKFSKAMEKLGNAIAEMEINLHGGKNGESYILNLVNAIENNYNNTARRLAEIGGFDSTIERLVAQDVKRLPENNTLVSVDDIYKFLDGLTENKTLKYIKDEHGNYLQWHQLTYENKLKYLQEHIDGVGSSKNLELARLVERYQGSKNSMNRIIHTLDVYRRALNPENFAENLNGKNLEYIEVVINKLKDMLLTATSSDHTLKLDLQNNPDIYKDIMKAAYAIEPIPGVTGKKRGFLTGATQNALGKNNTLERGNVLDRVRSYIKRFIDVVANSTVDYLKPDHIVDHHAREGYSATNKTRLSFFNLIGQNPVDLLKGAAKRRYSTQKWARIISGIVGSTFSVALLTQLAFGKLSNPQNLKKQVTNDRN